MAAKAEVLEWNVIPDRAGVLADNLRAVRPRGTIRIECGIAHPAIYNDPRVIEAFKEAKAKKDASIRVSTGPLLVTDENGVNGLVVLKEIDVLDKLYHRPDCGISPSEYTVETDVGYRYYKEDMRLRSIPITKRRALNLQGLSRTSLRVLPSGADLIEQFDGLLDYMEKQRFPGYDYLPILATIEQYDQIEKAAKIRGTDLVYLGVRDIRSLPGAKELKYGNPPRTLEDINWGR